uniref:Uncharacterized protein n=1 Tax=Periophthalmus magnuspinnatus TaxID=409849 RepID=A0A3B4AUW0_9GOBI
VFLVVAPLSVLYNWKDELETWGHFQCVVVHGLRKEEELNRVRKGRIEIALTTYETLRLCLNLFNDIDWSAVIVDEAHKIKNPNSQITQAMKELNCQIRIGLTGTVLQNNLEELWCVMDWAVPKCLGSLGHFKTKFSEPIEQGQKHNATKRALATGRKTVQGLVKKISHYFLRRTKALIKEQLPKKNDRVVYCSLTDFQQTVYQAVLDSEDVTLLLRSSEKCDCGNGHSRRRCCYRANSEGVEMRKLYFTYLAILRKIANHVALLQSSPGTSKNQYTGVICENVFQQFPDFVQRCKHESFEALSDPMYSGKMKVLQKLLHHYRQQKDKVLLFSLSTKLLDVLESYCMAEGLDYSRLDGNTKSKERVQIVKEFNGSSHINICLISTMAGGLGLNFVGANVVILFDPTWNPANDLQAIDRAYRIGQCRDVTVLRLISLGTVEEVIYLRQVYKQQLYSSVVAAESARRYFEAVQGNDTQKGELFGIKNLFRLKTQGTCLTRQILEREGQVEAGLTTTRTHMREEKEEAKVLMVSLLEPENATPGGVLDFSSDDDNDDEDGIAKKTSDFNTTEGATSTPGRMIFLEHSKLLQRVMGTPEPANGDSSNIDESSSDEDDPCSSNESNFTTVKDSDKMKKDIFKILSDSEPDENDVSKKEQNSQTKKHEAYVVFQSYTDESEDLDVEAMTLNRKKAPKRTATSDERSKMRQKRGPSKVKFTEEIEAFPSSEDKRTSKNPRPLNKPGFVTPKKQDGVSKTHLASPQSKNGSIDDVFIPGGVQEVAYTHSNQRIVGGSRAEELISRAAVRDVFELKIFSQMQANNLLGTREVGNGLPEGPPMQSRTSAASIIQRVRAEHPVTFRSRTTNQTRHTTFIIGETPQTICRYSKSYLNQPYSKSTFQQTKDLFQNIPSPEADWPEEKVEIATEFIKKIMKKDSDTFISTTFSNNRDLQMSPNSPADSKIPRFQETMDKPTISPNSQDPKTNCESSASTNDKSFLIDLIGDTSILDDLFKPKKNLPKTGSSSKIPLKKTSKDLWDILQEGNEASLNRLTDPGEVQRVCITARQHYKQEESESLWKTNERFIWKK